MIIPPPKSVSHDWKTPTLILPENADQDMLLAAKIFGEYANSDEFYSFLKKTVSSLDGGNESDLDTAIRNYRRCLNVHAPIEIVLKRYSLKNRSIVIGGWRKTYLAQNDFKKLDPVERASHWIHEISHACGFTHVENDIKAYPIIKQSWPYVVGRTFKEFLLEKAI